MKHITKKALAWLCSLCLLIACVPAVTEEQAPDMTDVETISQSELEAVFAEEETVVPEEDGDLSGDAAVMAEAWPSDSDAEAAAEPVEVFLAEDGRIIYDGDDAQNAPVPAEAMDLAYEPSDAQMGVMAEAVSDANDFVVKEGVLTSYKGSDQYVVIPDSLGILKIGDNAFKNNAKVSYLSVPEGVLEIGKAAFAGMTGLQRAVLPNSLLMIGESAFSDCTGMQSITIPGGVTELQKKAFYKCTGLRSATIEGNALLGIRSEAFSECVALNTINLPDSLQIIESAAFRNTSKLEYVSFGPSLLEINANAFNGSGLKTVSIPGNCALIGESAFQNCASLTSVSIGAGILSIGKKAFENCGSLLTVSLPNTLETIQTNAFKGDAIKTINWPDSLKRVEESAFQDCPGIQNLTAAGLIYIGVSAFSGCSGMTSADLSSVETIGEKAFQNASALGSVVLSSNLKNLNQAAFSGSGLTSLTIPGSAVTVPEFLCSECKRLGSVTIENGISSIKGGAFLNCTSLRRVSLPDSLTLIETRKECSNTYGAFQGCSALPKIVIPKSVTEIQEQAFSGCKTLTKIFIPRSVTVIGENVLKDSEYATVYAQTDSKAMEYCAQKGIKTVVVKDDNPNPLRDDLSKCQITVANKVYTGKALEPAVTVRLNGQTLIRGTDYSVEYANNIKIGKGTVTVTGLDDYIGIARASFKIKPKKVKGLKAQAGKNQLILRWKKVKGVSGYQIQYGLKKSFKGAKKITVKKSKTVKKALKKLKSGKRYYVRIRAYKKVGKKTYYSAWSKAVKKKVK